MNGTTLGRMKIILKLAKINSSNLIKSQIIIRRSKKMKKSDYYSRMYVIVDIIRPELK
jgi:hypothetical protein